MRHCGSAVKSVRFRQPDPRMTAYRMRPTRSDSKRRYLLNNPGRPRLDPVPATGCPHTEIDIRKQMAVRTFSRQFHRLPSSFPHYVRTVAVREGASALTRFVL